MKAISCRVAIVVTALALVVAFHARANNSAALLAADRGCTLCHDVRSPPKGVDAILPPAPSFEDIARRYRADPGAAERLSRIVREGTGPRPRDRHWPDKAAFASMYPNAVTVTDSEARTIVEWILSLTPPARR